jgi:MoaA/NifB/PqqE/SkfB family radical SAM enzyme
MNDITNDCNLRCPFCNNDFSKVRETIFMSKTTFEKVLQLLPLADSRFFFSCKFEPSIHPQFIEYLEMIPDEFKSKTFFTTNLVKTLSDETIERLSKLKISYINISVESFDPAVYESLRKGAKFSSFINNLERLVRAFSRSDQAPKLRYVTMVLKPNIHDLTNILELCSKKYLAQQNEFRGTHNGPGDDWQKDNFVSPEDWTQVERSLSQMPYNYRIQRFENKVNDRKRHKDLCINADGTVVPYIHGIRKGQYDLDQILDPKYFFMNLVI